MLWPDQQLLRQFKVDGRGADTGRKRQRVYEALDVQNLAEVARDDGTIVEAYEEIDPKPPSERQLEYAKKLGIKSIPPKASFYEVSNFINQAIKKNLVIGGRAAGLTVPDDLTYEQGRDLEELLWCTTDDGENEIWRHSSLPAEIEVNNARAIGVSDITEFTSAAMVFARAWEHLNSDGDKTVLAAWFIYNVYIDLASANVHESLMPNDPRLLVLGSEFMKDEKAAKSLLRSPTYLRFRAQQGGWSEAHAHASRTTLAYKQAETLIGSEFKIYRDRSDQKQPSKPKASRLEQENKDGCAAVVALFFILPLAAAGGLLWMISVNL
jgi:hypothetical protein